MKLPPILRVTITFTILFLIAMWIYPGNNENLLVAFVALSISVYGEIIEKLNKIKEEKINEKIEDRDNSQN